MAVKEKHVSKDQKSMSPHIRRIQERYGLKKSKDVTNRPRTINELYKIRYKNKFR